MSGQFTPGEVARLKKLVAVPRTTHVIQVLDRSSSMQTGRDITISTYNEQLDVMKQAQLRDGGVTTVTMVVFSYAAELAYQAQTLDKVQPLTTENYVPGGMTALYDAIGLAIESAKTLDASGDTAFLLQIFTDGEENQSKKFTLVQLKSMIEELNATGKWTVTVAGPKGTVDLFAKNIAIMPGNVTGFEPNSLASRSYTKGLMVDAQAHYFSARASGATSVADAYSSVTPPQNDLTSDKRPTASGATPT